jgi:hypothetical protein
MTAAKNAPAALAEYAQGLEKDNPSQASAPAEALQTLFQSAGLTEEQVQQQFPELAQSLRDAAETGVEVPLSQETMVKIQTLDAKEAYDEFANDVRLGPDEMTAREAAAEDGTLDEMIANMPEEQKEEAVVASLVEEIVKQQVAEGGMDARTARASATALIKGRVTMMKRARAHHRRDCREDDDREQGRPEVSGAGRRGLRRWSERHAAGITARGSDLPS